LIDTKDVDARHEAGHDGWATRANTSDYETLNVFSAGEMRRGQSPVVRVIREGGLCARAIDLALMGKTEAVGDGAP